MKATAAAAAYDAVADAIRYIDAHVDDQPELAEVARATGLSPFHTQRLFTHMAGISPKKFLGYLSLGRAKAALAGQASVLEASFDAGLSGPGRLHDLFLSLEAATPGEFKARGAGMTIRHGVADSPFGRCLLMWSDRGVTGLAFVDAEGGEAAARAALSEPYAAAAFVADPAGAVALARRVFAPAGEGGPGPLRLYVSGTPFQVKVWEALLRVPAGGLVAYEQVARAVGQPTAARAVGNAVGANPIAYLIPCHRVIRSTGAVGSYRWGEATKRVLLATELAMADAAD